MSPFTFRFAIIASVVVSFAVPQEDAPAFRRPDTAPDMDLKPIPVFTRKPHWHHHTDEISLPTPSWGNFLRYSPPTTEPSLQEDDYHDYYTTRDFPGDDAFYDLSSESGDYERHNHGEKALHEEENNGDSQNEKRCASAAGVALPGLLLSAFPVLLLMLWTWTPWDKSTDRRQPTIPHSEVD